MAKFVYWSARLADYVNFKDNADTDIVENKEFLSKSALLGANGCVTAVPGA